MRTAGGGRAVAGGLPTGSDELANGQPQKDGLKGRQ